MAALLWILFLIIYISAMFLLVTYFTKKKQFITSFVLIIITFFFAFIFALSKTWIDSSHSPAFPNQPGENDVNYPDNNDSINHDNKEKQNPDKDMTDDEENQNGEDEFNNNFGEEVTDKGDTDSTPPVERKGMDEFYNPDTKTYIVQPGDTLWAISQFFKVTVEELIYWNSLSDYNIQSGQSLLVEGGPIGENNDEQVASYESSKIIIHGNTNKKQIALTFDAGSDIAGITILDVLQKHGVTSTFFLTGKWIEMFPDYAKRLAADGHEIANHSYGHEDFVKITNKERISSIIKTDDAIKTILGVTPVPYFRFPYGSYNEEALVSVGAAGYRYSIHWSTDTIDWKQPEVEIIAERIINNASNGNIVLMHIGGIHTPKAVDMAIPILREMGYEIVTVSEVIQ